MQVCVPSAPHATLVVGAHAPSPVQVPQADHVPLSHVRVCVPQLPHACVGSPGHDWPPQVPHWQLPPQLCVPPDPHGCVALGAHAPSPVHAPHEDHAPLLHVRVCVPQLPQLCELGPAQLWPSQVPH